MYNLKLILLLGSAHLLMGQFLPQYTSTENSSEENAGQTPGARNTSCRCGWTNKHGRIVGGKEVLPNEFPFMVGIQEEWRGLICGGSILTVKHILTAAHCTAASKPIHLRVIVGTHDIAESRRAKSTQIIEIERTIEHENFNKNTFANDVSVIIVKDLIVFNQNVGPVCMPTERNNLVDNYIKVLGWGYLDSKSRKQPDHLMKVNLKVIETSICKWFEEVYGLHYNEDNQICTFRKAKDSCGGDSGGPLVWVDPHTNMFTQVALVSYGSSSCGKSRPAVNTNVFAYLPWIKDTVAGTNDGVNICQKI